MSDRCKSCEAPVKWVRMATGGKMLVNLPPEKRVVIDDRPHDAGSPLGSVQDTYTSHFATCPKADEHRRKHEN